MCRPQKQKSDGTPLVEKHKLLSSVYSAEFYSGTETAATPMKTVTKIFNASMEDRGAIPTDVSSNALEAFAPTKTKILLDEKEWKCICCDKGAYSYCSSVVGAPSSETVICFTEKIYVVCIDKHCIVNVLRKKNEGSKKLTASDFDFRFSFRSALRPIRIVNNGNSASSLEMPVEKEAMKNAEMKSVTKEEEKPLFVMEKEIMNTAVGKDSESAMNFVSVNETKKRKRDATQELLPSNINEEKRHKRIKKNGGGTSAVQSSDAVGGAYVSRSVQCPPMNDMKKKRDEGVKENVGVNAAKGNSSDPKLAPTKVYLREFPFIFDGKGAWLCRHCLGIPYHSGSHHYYRSHVGKPPSNYFIDQHLRLCPVMFRNFSGNN